MEFTKEQKKVMESRGRSLLVSAAAGSGKTAVLVERIMGKLTDPEHPVDIDRMLIVTFTRAAASEMRERIGLRLRKELELRPSDTHLEKQMTLLHNALITTIDGFCLYLVRNHFDCVELDPSFRMADEGEMKLLEKDVLEAFLEEEYEAAEPDFIDLMKAYAVRANDTKPDEMISSLYRYALSHPYPEEWLSRVRESGKEMNADELSGTIWFQALSAHIENSLDECEQILDRIQKLAEDTCIPDAYLNLTESDRVVIRALRGRTFQDGCKAWNSINFIRMPINRHEEDQNTKSLIATLRNREKKICKEISAKVYAKTVNTTVDYVNKTGNTIRELAFLTMKYQKKMDAAKRERNLIDFSDMEHLALQILLKDGQPTSVALEYRDYFEEIMIDEYQDSNAVQELLLQTVSGEGNGRWNRFLVGDVKQSIYKFRLARPEIFMEKYAQFPVLSDSDSDGCCERIDLNRNFRSREQVIQTVNDIFSKIMYRAVGNVEYDEDAALKQGAVFPVQNAGAGIISDIDWKNGSDMKADSDMGITDYGSEFLLLFDSEKTPDCEIRMIAARIKQLVGTFQVTDKKTGMLRPASYGDIVILMRAVTGWEEPCRRVMEEQGIPLHMISKSGYFSTGEVAQILNLLAVLDNPRQEIPFVGTLKSLFFGYSDEEIAILRLTGGRTGNFYENFVKFAESTESQEPELIVKAKKTLEFLNYYRQKVPYTPIAELLYDILEQTDYLNLISCLPGGEQRRANVCLLIEKAEAFADTSYMGLFHFLRYIDQLKNRAVDFGEANTLAENADVVRVMTIHKSKGLEFPICFVTGLGRHFSTQDSKRAMLADADFGIALDVINHKDRTRIKTLKKQAAALKIKLDSRGEDLRVLYVAMTRAKEKLILTARTDKDREKFFEDIEGSFTESRVGYSELIGAVNYLDILKRFIRLDESTSLKTFLYTVADFDAGETAEALDFGIRKSKWEHLQEDTALSDKWKERFARVYPYEQWKGLYNKTTVSEIKKAAYEEEEEAGRLEAFPEQQKNCYVPEFLREKEEENSGAERGTAYHRVMELLPFEQCKNGADPESFIRVFCSDGRMTIHQADLIRMDRIREFVAGNLGARMAAAEAAGKLQREQPFVLGVPANRLNAEFPETKTILVQGVIDACFEEQGELVVLDYKTDRVKTEEMLVLRYKTQLAYYAEALEQLTGKKVKEKLIYSFSLGTVISL